MEPNGPPAVEASAHDTGKDVGAARVRRPRGHIAWRVAAVALVAAALTLTIFPFDWLTQVWPAYRVVFDRVFVTARDHAIGHTTLFGVVGMVVLAVVPWLRTRVWRYLALGLLGALAQEAVQALAKQDWPNLGDARDILFDTLGLLLAFLLIQLIVWGRARRAAVTR